MSVVCPTALRICLALVVLCALTSPSEGQTLAGGDGHSVVLKSDGTVWTFGDNANGQLGDNTITDRRTPTQVAGLTDIVAVAAGGHHSLALSSGGALYVWGDNLYGQVGDGTATDRKSPVLLSLANVVAVSAGLYHSIALSSNGDVHLWGRNSYGQLGTGNTTNSSSPVLILSAASAVAAGHEHSVVVKTDGTAWATGRNLNGELGDGTTTLRTSFVQMSGLTTAAKAAVGYRHSLLLLADGTVKAVGLNTAGQLGDGTTTQRTTAVTVAGLADIVKLGAGYAHSMAVNATGTLWVWGENSSGQIGDGTTSDRHSPTELPSLAPTLNVGGSHYHTLAVNGSGVVRTWGLNTDGQLGDGTIADRSIPASISGDGFDWKVATPTYSVAAGTYSTDRTVVVSVVTSGATIHYTQNGSEPTEADSVVASGGSVVVNVSQTLKAKAWKAVMPPSETQAAVYTMKPATPTFSPNGGTHTSPPSVTMSSTTPGVTLRYTTDGSTPTQSSTAYTAAVPIPTTTTLKAVAFKANWSNSDVKTATFTMNFGTLSAPTVTPVSATYESSVTVTMASSQPGATVRYTTDGSTPTISSAAYSGPIEIGVTATIKAKAFHPDYTASAETSRSYVLVVAAPVFGPAGGSYAAGQLVTVSTPTAGATITYTINGVDPTPADLAIASGASLLIGNVTLKAKAWKTGATPSGVTAGSYTVTGDVTPASLAAGYSHSLAIRSDGVLWAWGQNSYGALGDGTTATAQVVPVAAAGLVGIVAAAGGEDYSLALRMDGSVLAFGRNTNGRLGDGTTSSRTYPTTVSGLTGVAGIAAGTSHGIAVKTDGTVRTWGSNYSGEIGDGTITARLTPTVVSGLSDAVQVAAGYRFSIARTASGGVYAWGWNTSGRLGDGTTINRTSPVVVAGVANATMIASAGGHSLALLQDGSVRAWGANGSGELGDGTTTDRPTAITVNGLESVTAVAAGFWHSLALKSDGTVWAFGENASGQLGDGTTTDRKTPIQVPGLSGIVLVAAGEAHSVALAGDGTIWAWGQNGNGQLGDGTIIDRHTPVAISGSGMTWRVATPTFSVASGTYNTDRTVTIGDATSGAAIHYTQNGAEPTEADPVFSGPSIVVNISQTLKAKAFKAGAPPSATSTATYVMKVAQPTFSPAAGTFAVAQNVAIATATPGVTLRYTIDGTDPIAASPAYVDPIAIATTTTVKAAGFKSGWSTSDLRTGTFTLDYGLLAPPAIAPAAGTYEGQVLVTLSSIAGSTIRYTTNGATPGTSSPAYTGPFAVATSSTVRAKAYHPDYAPSAESSRAFTIAAASPVLSVASGTHAPGTTVTISSPEPSATIRITLTGADPTSTDAAVASGTTLVVGGFTLKARAFRTGANDSGVAAATYTLSSAVSAGVMAGGASHALLATPEGLLFAWGLNSSGQVGDGTTTARTVATLVPTVTGAVGLAAGSAHSLAVTADGRAFAWGSNGSGRLGDGTTTNRSRPVAVIGVTDVVAVAAGTNHSLALTAAGEVHAWGGGTSGQLGLGAVTQQLTPVQVTGLTSVVAIAAGDNHSLAVTASGQLYAWGSNSSSQLGDGTTTNRTVPTLIGGLDDVAAVAAGSAHSLARKRSGEIYTWGAGTSGQLGLGHTLSKTTPTLVPAVNAVMVFAGASHSVALTSGGSLVAWGANASGQIGDTTTTVRTSPVTVNGPAAVTAATAGGAYSVAISPSGAVWTWGSGNSGQLADGTLTNRPTPAQVFADGGRWAPAPPIVSLVSGTFNQPQDVTLTSPVAGPEVRYTTSGADPGPTDTLVDVQPIAVDGTTLLLTRAFVEGHVPSARTSARYTLRPDTPTITPPAGTFSTPQTVAIGSTTAQTTVRYSVDGSDPTSQSPLYGEPFAVATTSTIRARAFRAGWTESLAASTAISFSYGSSAIPVMDPPGGRYTPGQTVAVTAEVGAAIRYTLDGTAPSAASALYAGPIVLVNGQTVVKAIAIRTDWTPSATASATYFVTSDWTPPIITASVSPEPNAAGWWSTGPVTVTFTCSDADSAIQFCTALQTVYSGRSVTVEGRADDTQGNSATTSVVIAIDEGAPVLTINDPVAGEVFPVGTTSIALRGSVADAASGADTVTCAGVAATITGTTYTCAVGVTAGNNTIQVTAQDRAGYAATRSVQVRVGLPLSIEITPARMMMTAGEVRDLGLVDEKGKPLTGGTWSISDPAIASIAEPEETQITALAPGQATLTYTLDTLTATATVTIVAAGGEYPGGSVLWELPPSSSGTAARGRVVPANRADPNEPQAYFFVDLGTKRQNGLHYPPGTPTVITATSAGGRQLWQRTIDAFEVKHAAADNDGGLVVYLGLNYYDGEYWDSPMPERIQRLDGTTGRVTWEYFTDYGLLSEVAIGPDGRVFFRDDPYYDPAHFVAIEGATGAVTLRASLRSDQSWPDSTGPIIRENGSAVLLSNPKKPGCPVQLVQVAPGAVDISVTEFTGVSESCSAFFGDWGDDGRDTRLLPDGAGSLLLVSKETPRVRRIDPVAGVGPWVWLASPSTYSGSYETQYVLGDDGAFAMTKRWQSTDHRAELIRFNPLDGTADLPEFLSADEQLHLSFAGSGGIAYVSGSIPAPGAIAQEAMVAPGLWAGWLDGPAIQVGESVPVATTAWPYAQGNAGGANVVDKFRSNFHAILLDTIATPDEIFNTYLRTYAGVNGGDIATVEVPPGGVSAVGQTLMFTLVRPIAAFGQGPFEVELVRFDPANRTIAARTVCGHPLDGWRYWRVSPYQGVIGRVVIETGAVDRIGDDCSTYPYGWILNTMGFFADYYFFGEQLELWHQYLQYIKTALGAIQPFHPDYTGKIMRGVWGANTKYIMTHVCGHAPAVSGLCQ